MIFQLLAIFMEVLGTLVHKAYTTKGWISAPLQVRYLLQSCLCWADFLTGAFPDQSVRPAPVFLDPALHVAPEMKVQAQQPQCWMEADFAKLTVCQVCMVLPRSRQHSACCFLLSAGEKAKWNLYQTQWKQRFCGNKQRSYCCRPERKNSYQPMDVGQSKVHGLENMDRRK